MPEWGADLYESYVGSIISSSALGVAAFGTLKRNAASYADGRNRYHLSIIGTIFVKTKENADQKSLLRALSRGTNFSAVVIAVAALPLVNVVLGDGIGDFSHIGLYFSILAGLVAGVLIGQSTEYFTSDSYKPTKKLASTSETGSATIIIGGLSLGMMSTVLPIIIISVCVLVSYFVSGGASDSGLGLYRYSAAAVGVIYTRHTLATDAIRSCGG